MSTALILGASGLVGRHCLKEILALPQYDRVFAPVRRPLAVTHPKLQAPIVDFDRLDDYPQLFLADDVFCCMGTTMKQAGSKAAFYRVDFTIPITVAKKIGIGRYFLVSSIGADAGSLFYYLKVKGELEQCLKALPLTALHIYRPSVLLGERNETRIGEKIGESLLKGLSFALVGKLKKYRGIEASVVARAMANDAAKNENGIFVYESDDVAFRGR